MTIKLSSHEINVLAVIAQHRQMPLAFLQEQLNTRGLHQAAVRIGDVILGSKDERSAEVNRIASEFLMWADSL